MAIKQTPELEHLMQEAFDKNARLFYLIPNEPPVFRIKNSIQRSQGDSFTAEQIKDIATAALGKDALKDIGSETGQLTTLCTLPGIVDGRMHITKISGDYAITIYLMPTSLPDVDCVRVPKAILEAAMLSRGLVLFSGPTGSGKTTSLFSTLDYINSKKSCTICTLEYSIEYHLTPKMALIQQREVGVDIPDMLSGKSVALSQDPDVLMIGELRSSEEIQSSVTIAQLGCLVLTQVHTDSPEAAIERMIDVFPEENKPAFRRDLARYIEAVCAQKLLERADGKGQVAVYGVLIPDDQMRKAIAEGCDIFDRKTPLPDGCQTIAEDIEKLQREGVIDEKTMDKALNELKREN